MAPMAATSASSVGVVVGKMMSEGVKPLASSRAIMSSVVTRSAVASISLTSQPRARSSDASNASV